MWCMFVVRLCDTGHEQFCHRCLPFGLGSKQPAQLQRLAGNLKFWLWPVYQLCCLYSEKDSADQTV